MDKIYELLKEMKEIMEEDRKMLKQIFSIMNLEDVKPESTVENNTEQDSNKKVLHIAELGEGDDIPDPKLFDVIDTIVECGVASTSFVQRKFKFGYARASRVIDQAENLGIISGYRGSEPREVLYKKEQWEAKKKELLSR